jgi:hypothetical protein
MIDAPRLGGRCRKAFCLEVSGLEASTAAVERKILKIDYSGMRKF